MASACPTAASGSDRAPRVVLYSTHQAGVPRKGTWTGCGPPKLVKVESVEPASIMQGSASRTKVAAAACPQVGDPLPWRLSSQAANGGFPYSHPRCVWGNLDLPGNARLCSAGSRTPAF